MAENDEEALKTEIDEIMNRVKTIMDNVAKVMPREAGGADNDPPVTLSGT